MQPKIVSIINYKGGVGKTTLTANLAVALAMQQYRVLLIDTDPQASLSLTLFDEPDWIPLRKEKKTIQNWLLDVKAYEKTPDLSPYITKIPILQESLKKYGNVDAIIGMFGFFSGELSMADELRGDSVAQVRKKYILLQQKLQEAIYNLSKNEQYQYDIVIIDCPPNINTLTKMALFAADKVLIPGKADFLSFQGMRAMQLSLYSFFKEIDLCSQIVRSHDDMKQFLSEKILGFVFTMVKDYAGGPKKKEAEAMENIRNFFRQEKINVFESYLKNDELFVEATQQKKPVLLLNPAGHAGYSSVASQIRSITNEFLHGLQLPSKPQ